MGRLGLARSRYDNKKARLWGRAGMSDFKVFRRFFAAICYDFIFDLLAFVEASQTGLLNSRDVNENVFTACIGLDEAESLRAVEPLHGACSHL